MKTFLFDFELNPAYLVLPFQGDTEIYGLVPKGDAVAEVPCVGCLEF